jgi:hypothetical protein
MPLQSPDQIIRSSARGRQNYRNARQKIAASLLTHQDFVLGPANKFLTETLFKLDADKWFVLGFSSKDWPILDQLLEPHSTNIEHNYESLVCDYVISNASRVNRLYEASAKISAAVFRDDGDAVTKLFDGFDRADKQSIFSFRTYTAQRIHSNELLVEYFKREMSTDWLKKRFLYPFVSVVSG